jgi:hypothetical protein
MGSLVALGVYEIFLDELSRLSDERCTKYHIVRAYDFTISPLALVFRRHTRLLHQFNSIVTERLPYVAEFISKCVHLPRNYAFSYPI